MTEGKNNCPCKRKKCERYGDCEACIAHHRRTGRRMACELSKTKEVPNDTKLLKKKRDR